MALPRTLISSPTHQKLVASWQVFPIWTMAFHHTLHAVFQKLSSYFFPADPHARPPTPLGASYLSNSKHVYRFVLFFCITTHLPILLFALVPSTLFPSSPFLSMMSTATPSSVVVPYFPSPSTQVSPLTAGVHTFLFWDIYIGSSAFLLWAILLYRNATTERAIVDTNTSLPIYREVLSGERKLDEGLRWRKLV